MNLVYVHISRVGTMIPLTQVRKGDEFDFYIHEPAKHNTVPWIATEDYSAAADSVQCCCTWSDGSVRDGVVHGYGEANNRTAYILSEDNVIEEPPPLPF